MILKSMSRKGQGRVHFPQLYDYISRDAQKENQIWHNFMHHQPDRATTVTRFLDNAKHIKQDARHNVLYHEVISLTRHSGSQTDRQIAALRQLAQSYLQQRAPGQLAYGAIHLDKDHSVHLHLMISANDIGNRRRVRLPKANFLKIQRNIEEQLQRDYPELEERSIYNREDRAREKTSDREQNLKKRTKAPSKKDLLREKLKRAFTKASTKEEARKELTSQGIELIERGKTLTAVEGKLRCRLTTLNLQESFEKICNPESPKDTRKEFLKELKDIRARKRDLDRENDGPYFNL